MRIAQIAPLFETVPPRRYGGTERVVHWLTEELVALGHDVTLFAAGGSHTTARLVPVREKAARFQPNFEVNGAPYMRMLELVRRAAGEFDVLHFHVDFWSLPLFSRQPTPFLTTLHGRMDQDWVRDIYGLFPEAHLVSISNSQRAPAPELGWLATVLHGMPRDTLRPLPATPGYLAFLGRMSPEKGIADALDIARAAGMRLKIAAKIGEEDRAWYEAVIAPRLAGPGVEYIGEIEDGQKSEFLSAAAAVLLPIAWPEPFGLVMIEAMACGCPVIAYRRGSVPEVLDEGETGFIVENVEQAVAAIPRALALDRAAIRLVFERRWTARRMAEEYLGLYARLASGGPARR
ncbi:MAG: glycosyltransferase family 4 protein [Rhodospirillales bacterium]|nr:glycosyltransferase family 4 protein [Rhodospirillales bacterium]